MSPEQGERETDRSRQCRLERCPASMAATRLVLGTEVPLELLAYGQPGRLYMVEPGGQLFIAGLTPEVRLHRLGGYVAEVVGDHEVKAWQEGFAINPAPLESWQHSAAWQRPPDGWRQATEI